MFARMRASAYACVYCDYVYVRVVYCVCACVLTCVREHVCTRACIDICVCVGGHCVLVTRVQITHTH